MGRVNASLYSVLTVQVATCDEFTSAIAGGGAVILTNDINCDYPNAPSAVMVGSAVA